MLAEPVGRNPPAHFLNYKPNFFYMIRVFAQWWAKKQYIFKQEVEAATAELYAGLSLKVATEKRAQIEQLNKEADDIDATIKSVDDKLTTGDWECENGHETEIARPSQTSDSHMCVPSWRRDASVGLRFATNGTIPICNQLRSKSLRLTHGLLIGNIARWQFINNSIPLG
jgi:hypothetical protein